PAPAPAPAQAVWTAALARALARPICRVRQIARRPPPAANRAPVQIPAPTAPPVRLAPPVPAARAVRAARIDFCNAATVRRGSGLPGRFASCLRPLGRSPRRRRNLGDAGVPKAQETIGGATMSFVRYSILLLSLAFASGVTAEGTGPTQPDKARQHPLDNREP